MQNCQAVIALAGGNHAQRAKDFRPRRVKDRCHLVPKADLLGVGTWLAQRTGACIDQDLAIIGHRATARRCQRPEALSSCRSIKARLPKAGDEAGLIAMIWANGIRPSAGRP